MAVDGFDHSSLPHSGARDDGPQCPGYGRIVATVRAALTVAVGVHCVFVLYQARSWSFGPDLLPLMTIALLYLPLLLVLWPSVRWEARLRRRTALLAGAVGLAVAFLIFATGRTASLGAEPAREAPPLLAPFALVASLAVLNVALLGLVATWRQRLAWLALTGVSALVVEASFALEERSYREQQRAVDGFCTRHHSTFGEYPSGEAFGRARRELLGEFWLSDSLRFRSSQDRYQLCWDRFLEPHAAVLYRSGDGWSAHD
jgi:hypothetical protein